MDRTESVAGDSFMNDINANAVIDTKNAIKSVCVYCGAWGAGDPATAKAAEDLGLGLHKAGMTLVYGGGAIGLMGIVSKAVSDSGGKVIGIIPHHLANREIKAEGLTELHLVDSMHQRKQMMVDKSDAFVVLPGGLGTLDETFEILTWKQLKLHDRPIILLNHQGYWQPLVDLIDHMIARGFARAEHRALFQVVDTVDAALAILNHSNASQMKPDTEHM